MWLVRVANRPYTFVVMALDPGRVYSTLRMPRHLTGSTSVVAVVVLRQYRPKRWKTRIVSGFERFDHTTVNDIEHTESQSLTGVVIKVFFHPGAKLEAATAQILVAQTALRGLPQGRNTTLIFCAMTPRTRQCCSSRSSEADEQQLFDLGVNFVRGGIVTVQGASNT